MTRALLARLGLPPRPSPAQGARAVALRIPVLLGEAGRARTPTEVAARGEGGTPEEVLGLLEALFPEGSRRPGPLPTLEVGGGVLGPGLPVLVTPETEEAPDGWYRLAAGTVLRESAGREGEPAAGLAGLEGLLIFTPEARWLLGAGRAVVEDPFCRVEAPLRPGWVEGFLVRRLRLDEGLLRHPGLLGEPAAGASRITAWRAAGLLPPDRRDPEAVFRAREGVSSVALRGDTLELRLETGARVFHRVEEVPLGWRAELVEGAHPVRGVELVAEGETLRFTWTVGRGLDLLERPVRARLAFDLTSDLVRLSRL